MKILNYNQNLSFRKEFYKTFYQYCMDKYMIAEFVRYHPLINNQKFSKDIINIHFSRKTVFVNLKNKENIILNKFDNSVIRNLNKAKKSFLIFNNEYNNVEEFINYVPSHYGKGKF